MEIAQRLVKHIASYESAVVGLSGGVDSCVLAYAARKALGKDRVVAATGDSATLPSADREFVTDFCRSHDIVHVFIDTHEYENPNYRSNPKNRCFFCKEELYRSLWKVAREKYYNVVLDGTNLDDLKGHRPGYQALLDAGVKAPLVDLKFDKETVRSLARQWKLDVADKPQSACLASRIPTGTPIDVKALQEVDRAETLLRTLGFRQVRVRHHGPLARLELLKEDWSLCLEKQKEIVQTLKDVGFEQITLDLSGYSRGI